MLYSKLQSRNDTVPTKRNDAAAFYQQATISLAKNQMLVVEFPSKPISSWLRKITQNDDASTNLDDAVLDMRHRYQLLVNPAGIHPSQRFKTSSCTFPNDVAAPIVVAQRQLLLLVSTCKTVLATRHSLVDPFNCARQPPTTSSNENQAQRLEFKIQPVASYSNLLLNYFIKSFRLVPILSEIQRYQIP
ncbi:Cyclin-like F-box domain containing protein [Dorcoceras hygrometricum]|uniref:Cyclin-like F-box domain containing protein n=1 Tax=Dorcoceras hygrometricum TaxID=472368 RepID=A0A2Z7C674_9LAMI|nr:Cyclin-like F-box domain containing protein [Dorcoceras hygrometricum]